MWTLLALIFASALASGSSEVRPEPPPRATPPTIEPDRPVARRYRASDGVSLFRFLFRQKADGWRVYVRDFPNPDHGSCHLYEDDLGDYICWSASIPSLQAATRIAAQWAEMTLNFQRTGQSF